MEDDYPHARQVTLVGNNLNTHVIASLYWRYLPAEAHRLACRLLIIHTPRNGRWLNMAEMELSVPDRQCINRRFENAAAMTSTIYSWE